MALNFSYLKSSSELDNDELKILYKLLDLDFLKDPANKYLLTGSLVTLTNLLYKHHKISPILLIDEYDVPVAKAAHFGYYREMINVVGQLLATGLKGNTNMKKAVLTGCLRATRESIFTGFNNMLVCSILDTGHDDISSGIGFTREEVQEVLTYYGLSDYYEEVRNNYDGYHFGTSHMYCPWDVMSFCYSNYKAVGKENKNITAGNYWINTSGNDVIEEFMGFIEPEDVDMMQDLLDGKSITAEVRTSLCYGDLQNHDINDFWTLLLYTGYLTFEPQSHNPESDEYSVYIPNEEIRKCFKSKILNYFKTNSVMKTSTGELVKGLFEGDAE
ncbi:MAG: AAA family ATPase, partial [Butyrivibrio sp.]|nr:AAA family ATPase [Butyrivibrio sp.]